MPWVCDTCYRGLSISSNMMSSPRVYLIIIRLKLGYIPKLFWKQEILIFTGGFHHFNKRVFREQLVSASLNRKAGV